jgi:hypothetical protein
MIVVGVAMAALCLAGYAADKAADDAKAYQETLEGMMGVGFPKVIAKFHEWKFEILDSWQAENPTAKDVSRHNRSKVKFSSQNYKDIFSQGGKFKVVVYNKLIGTDASTIGEVDQYGMSVMKDAEINLEKYTVIRAVFKDDQMINVKVWPKLEQSGFSGGTWLRR